MDQSVQMHMGKNVEVLTRNHMGKNTQVPIFC